MSLQTEMGQLRARLAKYEAEHSHATKGLEQKSAVLAEKDAE